MKQDVIPVKVRGILLPDPNRRGWAIFIGDTKKVASISVGDNAVQGGCTIFIGDTKKVFFIQVEQWIGEVIGMFLVEKRKERPLTHNLMADVFTGFGISVDRVVITELRDSTYYARMVLRQKNELGRKVVEVDARPSDCIALATAQKRPVYVDADLFEDVEDMSVVLQQINEANSEAEDD